MAQDPATIITELHNQIQDLRKQNEASQAQIARLLDFPDYTSTLRGRYDNNRKLTPLLMAYEAEIQAKNEKINTLTEELERARSVAQGGERHASVDLRTREAHADIAIEEHAIRARNLESDVHRLTRQLETATGDLAAARNQMMALQESQTQALDECKRAKHSNAQLTAQVRDLEERLQKFQDESDRLRQSNAAMRRQEEEERAEHEGRKIQLSLAGRENDDKVQELENLRNKMTVALKQAAANHTTHMRLVEEKHQQVVEGLREESRAHEATVLKLRAQLSRVDWHPNNGCSGGSTALIASGGVGSVAGPLSPVAAADNQARQSLELEVRRLYGEVTSAQVARDDALFRLEQAQSSKRNELDDRLRDTRRDYEALKVRSRDLEEARARLQAECDGLADQLRHARDELRVTQQDKTKLATDLSTARSEITDLQRRCADLTAMVDTIRDEQRSELDREKRQGKAQERRAEEAVEEQKRQKEAFDGELMSLQRQVDDGRTKLREALSRNASLQNEVNEKNRQVESLQAKNEKLSSGLSAHKEQLSACDVRLREFTDKENNVTRDLRRLTLQCEAAQLEAVRVAREKQRVEEEVNLLLHRQQSMKKLRR